MLRGLTLEEMAAEVGGPSVAPGGGSVAAYSGCLAAALVGMTCQVTIGKRGHESDEAVLRAALARADEMRQRLLHAVDDDTTAFLRVMEAYRAPKATDEERASRAAAISAALCGAAAVPLSVAEACAAVLGLAADLEGRIISSASSDLGVAVEMAGAALRGATLNVRTNLDGITDAVERRRIAARLDIVAAGVPPAAVPPAGG